MGKKSALQKKKDRPNSSYWMKKADSLFMAQFHGLPCEVCGGTAGTVGHHIVSRSRSKALRYDKRNIIILCPRHHTMGNDLAPHSTNQMAGERFVGWFVKTHPKRHAWVVDNERVERRYTFEQAFENLRNGAGGKL